MDIILAKRLATLNFEALREYANTELEHVKKRLLDRQTEESTSELRGRGEAMKELARLGELVDRTLKEFPGKT